LDLALADVVATSSDAALGAIRLAWWRERLEGLDTDVAAPAEPRLRAVADQLLVRGVGGKELTRLEDAWLSLLEPLPWSDPQAKGLKLRGGILFGIGARLLGGDREDAEAAGELWSLADGAHHCSDPQSREYLLAEARTVRLPAKVPSTVRPLTVLAALTAHDVRHGADGAGRVSAALAHHLRGKFPRHI
jgi:phytoene synthase